MRARLLVALAAGLLVGSDPAPDLGGVQSQEIPPGSRWEGGSVTWEFRKDGVLRIRTTDGSYAHEVKYALTPTTSPPGIELSPGPGETRAIYRLEGNHLHICLRGDRERPGTFADRPDVYQCVIVFKRLK